MRRLSTSNACESYGFLPAFGYQGAEKGFSEKGKAKGARSVAPAVPSRLFDKGHHMSHFRVTFVPLELMLQSMDPGQHQQ
jgi:hypothetical protein